MQEAAAGGDGLSLVAGAGFEPATQNPQPVDAKEHAADPPPQYTTRYTTPKPEPPSDGPAKTGDKAQGEGAQI